MIYTITLSPALDKTIHLNSFNKNETNVVENILFDPGGKGINTAKVLKSLGSDVTSIAFLGGTTGAKIEKMLDSLDINQKNIHIENETRTNIKIIENSNNTCTELNEKASPLSKVNFNDFDLVFENDLHNAEIITFSGRLPEGVDADYYGKYIKKANEKGIKTVLDTSGNAFKKGIEAKPWCIKPNLDELSEYCNEKLETESDIIKKSKEINELGVEIVIVTLGPKGVICTTRDVTVRLSSPRVLAKSTVGAGDSFLAGFIHKILIGETLENALKYAVAVSTAKVTLMGTGVPKKEDIEKYLEAINRK